MKKIAIFDTHFALSRKWYKIGQGLRIGNASFRMVPLSMILSDLEHRFQGQEFIMWRWISKKWYDIPTSLQWNTNREVTHALLRGVISNDLELSEIIIRWLEASRAISAAAARAACFGSDGCVVIWNCLSADLQKSFSAIAPFALLTWCL